MQDDGVEGRKEDKLRPQALEYARGENAQPEQAKQQGKLERETQLETKPKQKPGWENQ